VRDGTIVPKAPSGAAPAPVPESPLPIQNTPASGSNIRPPPPMPAPLPLQAAPPPPMPMQMAPPPAPIFTPPPAMPVAKTPGVLDLDQPAEEESPSTDAILNDPTRSALLVVLDEDQEMPPSERHERGKGSGSRPSQILKVESFEEDDDNNEKSGGLPELPRL
jgi:hypothetical protein